MECFEFLYQLVLLLHLMANSNENVKQSYYKLYHEERIKILPLGHFRDDPEGPSYNTKYFTI